MKENILINNLINPNKSIIFVPQSKTHQTIFMSNAMTAGLRDSLNNAVSGLLPEGLEIKFYVQPKKPTQNPLVAEIVNHICTFYEVDPSQLLKRTRKKEVAFARKVCTKMLTKFIPKLTLVQIADASGYKGDHSSVIKMRRTLENWMMFDEELKTSVTNCELFILSNIKFI